MSIRGEAWVGVPVGHPRKGTKIDFEDDGSQDRVLDVWGADYRDNYGFILVRTAEGRYGSLQTYEGRVRAADIKAPIE